MRGIRGVSGNVYFCEFAAEYDGEAGVASGTVVIREPADDMTALMSLVSPEAGGIAGVHEKSRHGTLMEEVEP